MPEKRPDLVFVHELPPQGDFQPKMVLFRDHLFVALVDGLFELTEGKLVRVPFAVPPPEVQL